MNMNFKIIDLDWEGQFNIIYKRDDDIYTLDKIPKELLNNAGFYQIYGRHPMYGNDVLLYIGETKDNEDGTRNFRTRLNEHLKSIFFEHTNLSVSLASYSTDNDTIKEIESVLICTHKPALNKQHLDKMKNCKTQLIIRNWSFLGSLNDCCTSYWVEK